MAVLLPSSSKASSSTRTKASQHEQSSSKNFRLTLFASLLVVCTFIIVGSSMYNSSTMTSYIKDSRGLGSFAAPSTSNSNSRIIPKSILKPCQDESLPKYADAPAEQRKSQFREDQKLLSLFSGSKPFCGGRYIEMGALDGVVYSNSHVLFMTGRGYSSRRHQATTRTW
mmetsp:Transcript_18957/g.45776  ORF Transcript_18957/g.45776 Transcript_18957/m.45776 type:complete len:169 (+) Transcript_18957:168-674(+)